MKDKVLDRFLFECRRDAGREKAKKQQMANLAKKLPEVSIYANAQNWYPTRIVELVCRDLSGNDETLGFFLEERHRISATVRRLRPYQGECGTVGESGEAVERVAVGSVDREMVSGDHWLHSVQKPQVLDPPGEVPALRALFEELIGEYDV